MANHEIHIDPDGTLYVDGKKITPGEVVEGVNLAHKAYIELMNRKNWTVKNVEKAVLYGAGVVAATNGFTALSLPVTLREWLLGGSALILAAVHISTPTKAA